jgi:hypothetical protein
MAFTRHRVSNTLDPVRVRTDGTKTPTGNDPTEERLRARVQQNNAYEKYKASLNDYFNGGKPLPDNLKAILATRPGALEHGVAADEEAEESPVAAKAKKGAAEKEAPPRRARRLVASSAGDYPSLVEAIKKASSPREVEAAVDALRGAGHPLPPDSELLSKALGHHDEAVICEALQRLLEVAEKGGIKSPRLLRTRIDNVALLMGSREVSELCGELKTRLVA